MAKFDFPGVWRDVKTHRRAYVLTAVASFGGYIIPRHLSFYLRTQLTYVSSMLFGWDTGLIGVCLPSHTRNHLTK